MYPFFWWNINSITSFVFYLMPSHELILYIARFVYFSSRISKFFRFVDPLWVKLFSVSPNLQCSGTSSRWFTCSVIPDNFRMMLGCNRVLELRHEDGGPWDVEWGQGVRPFRCDLSYTISIRMMFDFDIGCLRYDIQIKLFYN